MATEPAAGAVRRSIQQSLGAKLTEVTGLVNALNLEIFQLAERCENAETELAKYVGWEPTVREEYTHAVNLAERAKGVVDAFDRSDKLRVNQFVADLKHALEMP